MNSCQSFQAQPIARGRRCHGNGWPLRASKFTAFQFPRNVWTSPTAASEQVQRHGGSKIIKLILIYSFDLFIFSKMSRLNIPDASCIALSGKSVSEFKLITKWHKIISKLPEHIWGWKQAVHTDLASDVLRFLFTPLSAPTPHIHQFFFLFPDGLLGPSVKASFSDHWNQFSVSQRLWNSLRQPAALIVLCFRVPWSSALPEHDGKVFRTQTGVKIFMGKRVTMATSKC